MNKMNRRKFLVAGTVGLAGLSIAGRTLAENMYSPANDVVVDKVKLGNTGLTISRIAMGTGSSGFNGSSKQTRMGMESFEKIAHHAYEKGITFYDMAESYGSMPFVASSIKSFPREKLTLLSKIWTYDEGDERVEAAPKFLDRFRKAANTDYFDIILMHCMTKGNWTNSRKSYIEGLSRAKEDGIVKAVGVSCHNFDAFVEAVDSPWVDVILARTNPWGEIMDAPPEQIKSLLLRAIQNGKGVIGMKIFAEGRRVAEHEREESIRYAMTQKHVHGITLGFSSPEEIDDAVAKVMKYAR